MDITILASGKPSLCKRFSKDGDVVRSKKAEMSSYFRFESRKVDGIEEFASLRRKGSQKGVRPLKSKSQLITELAFLCAQANHRTSNTQARNSPKRRVRKVRFGRKKPRGEPPRLLKNQAR